MSEYILQPSEVEGEEGNEAVRTRRRRRVSAVLLL